MKVCAYIMTYDTGLAPNPFHGICTLAVCTPNHVSRNINSGDYIIGVAGVKLCGKLTPPSDPWRLIYAMKVDRRIMLDEYYNSEDYKLKIPKPRGSRIEMCGDNFYKLSNGKLTHTGESTEHNWEDVMVRDCHGNQVFIANTFNYFGSAAPKITSNQQWGSKLIKQLTKRSVNITYILGGKCSDPWTEKEDLREFLIFLDENTIDHIPDPIDFNHWKSEPDKKSSCAGCS
jgi:hypothetical protein